MTTEQIKKVCEVQCVITVCNLLVSKMPLGYTQDQVGALARDIKIRAMLSNAEKELDELVSTIGADVIGSTFCDKNIMEKPENRFTLEDQRSVIKEIIGEGLTLEELFSKYCEQV